MKASAPRLLAFVHRSAKTFSGVWWLWSWQQLRITSGRLPRIWGSILAPFATNSTAPHEHTNTGDALEPHAHTAHGTHGTDTSHTSHDTVTGSREKPSGQYGLRGCDEGGKGQKEGDEGGATTPNPNPNPNRGRGLSLACLECGQRQSRCRLLRCPATCRSGPVEN